MIRLAFIAFPLCVCLTGCGTSSMYECVERNQRENGKVDYVLLHSGHKIYAECDFRDVNGLDPGATCRLRPLQSYQCTQKPNGKALSDLRCEDSEGGNVYLYVSKED